MAGSISAAVKMVKAKKKFIEVEVKTLDEFRESMHLGINRIMLDNMNPSQIREAVRLSQGKIELEASGGVNLDNVAEIAETGVDYISIGELTHSAPSLDFNMRTKSLANFEK